MTRSGQDHGRRPREYDVDSLDALSMGTIMEAEDGQLPGNVGNRTGCEHDHVLAEAWPLPLASFWPSEPPFRVSCREAWSVR